MSQLVKITLTNPLGSKDSEELGLERRVHATGETIILKEREAMRLVGVGYVLGAEPGNPATIRKALTPVKSRPAAAQASKGE
ncbi:hypothetical protein [Nonomuraea recticatena]|uniref:Uncharacterized protein n=1 Tax=Nonomuraea recticatena TaxID=46178 RepID=A0ABN3T5R2_9ACTN